jgi:hypothetical protein
LASAINACGAATPDGEIATERTGRRAVVSDPDIVTTFPCTFGAMSKNAAERATRNRQLRSRRSTVTQTDMPSWDLDRSRETTFDGRGERRNDRPTLAGNG